MIKAVIFDFDGVVVESNDIKTAAFARLFESEGRETIEKVLHYHLSNTGVSRFEKFRYIYKNFLERALSENMFKELCKRFSDLVVEGVINAPFVLGAKEFLLQARKSCLLFLLSATPQKEIEYIIKKRGIAKYFKEVYGAPNQKNEVVKRIMVKYKFTPGDLVYVGDSLSDYRAATANAVKFIARINSNRHLFTDALHCVNIKDLSMLQQILSKL